MRYSLKFKLDCIKKKKMKIIKHLIKSKKYLMNTKPNFNQVTNMLNIAFNKYENLNGLIFHSDQGWQYQMKYYQQRLIDKDIKQSFSRKGNCIDNSLMENFFDIMKKELI